MIRLRTALRRIARRTRASIRRLDRATTAYLTSPGTDTLAAYLRASDQALRDIARRPPDDETAASVVQQAALAHVHAFHRFGGAEHAELAAELLGTLLDRAPAGAVRLAAQVDLATLEFTRYTEDGEIHRLERSIELYEDALRQGPASPRHHPILLDGLANALVELGRRDSRRDVLDRAVQLHQDAVREVAPEAPFRTAMLVNWATALVTRWQRSGDPADLQQAIEVHEELSRAPDTDEQVVVARAELLWEIYAAEGDPARLEEVVAMLRPVVDTVPEEAPLWRTAAVNLANALLERRWRFAAEDPLGTLQDRAARVTRPGTPDWARLRHVDGLRHWQDYLTAGDLGRLAQALAAWRDAASSVPETDASRAVLLNSVAVGTLQHAAHQIGTSGALAAAEEAVDAARQAVDAAAPGTASAAVAWNSLGHALGLRHRLSGRPEDVRDAVEAWRTAVDLSPAGSRSRAGHLASLASGLRERAAAGPDEAAASDLREAIPLHQEAIALMAGSVELPGLLANLGMTLYGLAARTRDPAAYVRARQVFQQALEVGRELAPTQALDAALAWRRLALDGIVEWPDLATASDAALAALQRVLRSQVLRADKEAWLRTTVDVTASAGLAHAALGDMEAAVLALEGGRGLLLVEALPPVGLEQARPELFARFLRAAAAVESMQHTVYRHRATFTATPPEVGVIGRQ
jgi:tetratricopeptide (TPR) repeat protein